jgi:hypothetical protein
VASSRHAPLALDPLPSVPDAFTSRGAYVQSGGCAPPADDDSCGAAGTPVGHFQPPASFEHLGGALPADDDSCGAAGTPVAGQSVMCPFSQSGECVCGSPADDDSCGAGGTPGSLVWWLHTGHGLCVFGAAVVVSTPGALVEPSALVSCGAGGTAVGAAVGSAVGSAVGAAVGSAVGAAVGSAVGAAVGS